MTIIVPLVRDELPIDTVELARIMAGKCLVHEPLRFYEPGSAFVSGPKRLLEPLMR